MKRTLVIGKGYIGERIGRELGCRVSARIIRTFDDAQAEIDKHRPSVIINAAGFTGVGNVDGCELDKDLTLFSNSYLPLLLAEVCLRNRIKLVHISSGCIFHYDYKKDKPLTEEDQPDFLDLFYSRSKIYSEGALEALEKKCNILIVRIRIPLDNRPGPKNILDKLLKYKKVIDVPNSVTYIPDLIKALSHLIRCDARGIYNVVNQGGLRYPKLLDTYRKFVPDFRYQVIDLKKLGMVRTNLLLSTRKLKKSGFAVRSINDVLEECVQGYLQAGGGRE